MGTIEFKGGLYIGETWASFSGALGKATISFREARETTVKVNCELRRFMWLLRRRKRKPEIDLSINPSLFPTRPVTQRAGLDVTEIETKRIVLTGE